MKKYELDGKDLGIIALLREDARLTAVEIGARVGLSRTAVSNRIRALEERGVIEGYHARIKLPDERDDEYFLANIDVDNEHFEAVRDEIAGYDEIVTILHTTGRSHLTMIGRGGNRVQKAFAKKVNRLNGVSSGVLNVVLDVVKGSISLE